MRSWTIVAADFSINLVTSVTLFAVFVAGFFFVIATKVEVSAVKRNTTRVVDELFQDVNAIISEDMRTELTTTMNDHLKTPDMSSEDKEVAEKNAKLVKSTLTVLGAAFGAGVVVVLMIWGFMKWRAGPQGVAGVDYPNILRLLGENGVLLLCVAIAEGIFLYSIGGMYRSLDANKVRRDAIATVRSFSATA